MASVSPTRSVPAAGQRAQLTLRLRKASIARFTATPSALSVSGGEVHLQAVVHSSTKCRFSSARTLKGLPSTKGCTSGRASVNIKLPRNTTLSTETYVFYLTVRRAGGASTKRRVTVVEHGSATLTVTAAPVITTQPTSVTVSAGTPVAFPAAASGNPTPSVQWQVSTDGGGTWVNLAGATSTIYLLTASTRETGYEYQAVFTNVAGSATTNAATLTVPPEPISRFSGYIAYAAPGASFSAVTASWTVPTVTCPPGANTWATQWPGIGFGASVEQDGTQESCIEGSPSYGAWYEMLGDPSVNEGLAVAVPRSTYPVSPGDAITASVSISGATWTLALNDTTKKWTFNINIPSPTPALNQGAAQWLVEGPAGCPSGCYWGLADFGAVRFTGATAELNGQTGPISAFSPSALQMTSGSTLWAAPGPLDLTGEEFTDTWYAN